MYNVFDINGNVKCEISAFEYRGEFMSVSSIVATIKSSTPIDFANGDYISFRGEKYTLRYTPAYKKQARKDTYSEAFVYDSMVFYAASDELTRCDFLDVVKTDNNIHYTSLPNFTFYAESVQELADRIKANLDRLYKGANTWTVNVAEGTVSKPHNFTCSNIKCWDALVLANTELDLNFIIKGRTITIGSVGSAIEHEFSYGKGNGLKDLSSSTSESAAIITRLRAYGSTRNLPYRYYNKLYIDSYGNVKYFKDTPSGGYTPLLSESMYMPNLMLPMIYNGSLIGNTGDLYNEDGILCGKYRLGGTLGRDAYIESVTGIEKYGINEGTVFFDTDTEDGEDNIYPSMEGMTAQQLIDAGFDIQLDAGDNGNLDEIYSAEEITNNGYPPEDGSDISPSTFKVMLKDIGFDISDYLLPGETAQIYFASGELVGRTFDIASITKSGKKQILQINRLLDSDIEWVFPNNLYNAKAGDKFKLINIYMPDEYVIAAMFRVLERAKLYLAENDHNTINYAPTIDDIFLARNPQIAESIREGDIFTFSDDDLGLYKSITISTISIKIGESLIPKYSITLSENKDATLVDRITSQVSDSLGKTYLSSGNIVSLSKLQFDKRYLRKDTNDTAQGKITLAGGAVADHLTSSTYTSGFGGKGYEIKMEDGESYLTVDNAYIRNKATFDELEIREVTHTGGVEIKSPASCTIADVALYYPHIAFVDANGDVLYVSDGQFLVLSSTASGYKCFFKASDGEKTIYNDWRVGDLALCHEFNLATGSRYYHRRVLAVSSEPEDGYHWVALSETDAQGTDTPIKGDTIVCFGSNIADRQNAIVLASNGDNAPYFAQLKGLDSFAISEENYITLLSPTKNIIKGNEIILMAESGDKNVGDEIESTKAALSVESDRISSVVSAQEGLVKQYGYADFTIKCGWLAGTWITNAQGNNIGSPLGYEKDTACQLLILTDVEKGDAIRVVPNAKTQIAVVQIYGCDGDAQGAEQDAFNLIGEEVQNYTWYGRSTTLVNNYDIDVDGSAEYPIPVDCREVHIWLSDDWSEKANIQIYHIKAKISAQSRIDQTADNIRLQVGEAGINLDSKVITLDASKTIVTGDLAVRTVKTYWDAAQTQLKSAYNGNGEGTIVYYYPNGQVMKEDTFVTDSKGNVQGMRTTYYKADGSVAWTINEGGFMTTLPDYWTVLNNGNDLRYTTDVDTMMEMLKQYLTDAMKHFSAAKFSRFVSQSGNYKNYNGKVSKAVRSSETPTDAMLWAGVLVYSVELYEDGWNPTYIVTYEVCTTALGQVGAIVTKKFNNLGEIS